MSLFLVHDNSSVINLNALLKDWSFKKSTIIFIKNREGRKIELINLCVMLINNFYHTKSSDTSKIVLSFFCNILRL